MGVCDDERGQSIQIGVVILLGALIVLFSTYQAFVVPQQNAEVEAEHQEVVDRQTQDLRNAIVSLPSTRTGRAVTLTLGTTYPARIVALNPNPPSGSVRTVGTASGLVNLTLSKAQALDDETGDFWNGTRRSYNDGGIVYVPNYNEYENPATVIYENTHLYKEFRTGNLSVTGQRLVDGNRLTLVTLNGSLDRGSAESTSLDVEAISASDRSVAITNETGETLAIEVASQRDAGTWREILDSDEQYTDQGGHVVRGGVTETTLPGRSFDIVTIRLERNVQYELTMAKAGIGSRVSEEDAAYLTDVSGNGVSIEQGTTRELVVEVRDRYNNPVAGVTVFGTAEEGTLGDATVRTDIRGRAVFEYDSTGVSAGTYSVNFSLGGSPDAAFEAGEPENVTMSVTVEGSGRGNGSAYTLEWEDPSSASANNGASLSGCSSESCIWDVGASDDATLALSSTLQPPYEGIDIEFGVSNSTVGSVKPTSDTTDATGSATTDLEAMENGTVDVLASADEGSDVIEVVVDNVTSGAGVASFPRVAYVDVNDGTLRGIDTDGDTEDYTPGATDVEALGQPNVDFDGDGNRDVPYVTDNGNLRTVDRSGNTVTLDGSQSVTAARLGIGDWDDDSTNEVVYVRDNVLYSVEPGGSPERLCYQACNGNPRYYQAQSVAGITDFGGDSDNEVVYVDSNDDLNYFDQVSDGPTATGVQVDAADAVSRPLNYDNDGDIEVAYVDGNSDISLADVNGNDGTRTTTYDIRQDAISGFDWTGDGTPDVIHVDSNTGEMRYLSVVDSATGSVTESNGQTPAPQDGPGIG